MQDEISLEWVVESAFRIIGFEPDGTIHDIQEIYGSDRVAKREACHRARWMLRRYGENISRVTVQRLAREHTHYGSNAPLSLSENIIYELIRAGREIET
jgi:hypothetical protein